MLVEESKKWEYALGLNQLDGVEPPPEFLAIIEQEKNGQITMSEALEKINELYGQKEGT